MIMNIYIILMIICQENYKKSFDYSDFKNNIEDSFDISKIARNEKNKISNPIIDLKNYIKYCVILIFVIILSSIYYTFMESFWFFKNWSI